MKVEWKNNKKIILWGIGILLILSLIVGISYAYWMVTKKQEGLNKVSSGCFNIELSNEKNDIILENAYPITDEEGRKLVPYSFTVTNTCSLFASYNINLEMLEGTTLASKYIKVMVNNEEIKNLADLETTNIVLSNSVESRKLTSGSLGSGDSEDYTVRIWLDGNITLEDKEAMNKVMLSKVVVDASVSKYNPVDSGITLLKDAILANEYQTTDIELAKRKIANKQAVDFSKTAPIIDWEENHDSNLTTRTVTLPDQSLVESGIVGTENLTVTNILPGIGDSYNFNNDSGYYNIKNVQNLDPMALNYQAKDYYFRFSYVSTNSQGKLEMIHESRGSTEYIMKITNVTKSEGTLKSDTGQCYKAVIYRFTGYNYTQREIENDKSDKGIYQMNDEYGTSYYYRGSVNNNYVLFGGHYWRIIRINGDGSIRLLYAGTKKDASGEGVFSTLTDSSLGLTNAKKVAFNAKRDNPAYVGYMYGNTLNSSYAESNANEVESDIKKYLDSWYRQNIVDKGLSSFIADSGFCNDRILASNSKGNGVTNNERTYYSGYQRYYGLKTPSLLCSNKNDLFTVNSDIGNGSLIYSVGIITVDELMLSGYADGKMNRLAWSYSPSEYWSISPSNYETGVVSSYNFVLDSGGFPRYRRSYEIRGVRPVINLKAETEISGGIGTSNEPFIIN